VKGGTEAFFNEVQRFYEQLGIAPVYGHDLPATYDIPEDTTEFERSKRFGPVDFRRYEWDETYLTVEYLDLLFTYSSHRSLGKGVKERLFSSIADLIDSKYQGRIIKRYMAQMAIAKTL
jgi:hypothetical protein